MADFNTAVHLEPFNVQVLMGRAHVLRDQGKASEAVQGSIWWWRWAVLGSETGTASSHPPQTTSESP